MSTNGSGYSVITDTQERLLVFDTYITSTIGITLGIIFLSSFIRNLRKNTNSEDKYYRSAVICGITSCSLAILMFFIRLFFTTDLIFPFDFGENLEGSTIVDSVLIILWGAEKVTSYFGFVFIYTSLASQGSIETVLKVMMVFVCLGYIALSLFYGISDVVTTDAEEISVGETRGILFLLPVTNDTPTSVIISASLFSFIELVAVAVLVYKFYSNGIRKGIVLLSISFLAWMSMFIADIAGADYRYFVGSMVIVVDIVCLFLIFDDNQEIYNNLCGCICGGSKYKPVEMIDADDGVNEEEDDQQQLV